jgi:hypothetical protein
VAQVLERFSRPAEIEQCQRPFDRDLGVHSSLCVRM